MPLTYLANAVASVTPVTAVLLNALRDRAMNVFVDDAARVVSVPSPEAGQPFYYRTGELDEGLYLANTAGDVTRDWKSGWGPIENGLAYTAAATGAITSASPTWTALGATSLTPLDFYANRRYRIAYQCEAKSSGGAARDVVFRFALSTGTVLATEYPAQKLDSGDYQCYSAFGIYECGATQTAVTARMEFQTTAGAVDLAKQRIVVEDIGAWDGPV